MTNTPAGQLCPGDEVPRLAVSSISGGAVVVPDDERLVHLQFRRFAGCPVCHLHLRTVVRRHDEIDAAGIVEVVLFHSSTEELERHAGDLPFAVVADPDKVLYHRYGVESARRALLDPRGWPAIIAGSTRSAVDAVRRRRAVPSLSPAGGRYGLPADLLIAPDGRVVAAKYGIHVDDQWSVDELLALARDRARVATGATPGSGPGARP